MIPSHRKYVIIGAGIHGLSTAWHLARELKAHGKGSGADIIVLDKTGIGAGASGIACGFAPHHVRAMAESLGRTTPTSKYSPDLSMHPVPGAQGTDKEKYERYIANFEK